MASCGAASTCVHSRRPITKCGRLPSWHGSSRWRSPSSSWRALAYATDAAHFQLRLMFGARIACSGWLAGSGHSAAGVQHHQVVCRLRPQVGPNLREHLGEPRLHAHQVRVPQVHGTSLHRPLAGPRPCRQPDHISINFWGLHRALDGRPANLCWVAGGRATHARPRGSAWQLAYDSKLFPRSNFWTVFSASRLNS